MLEKLFTFCIFHTFLPPASKCQVTITVILTLPTQSESVMIFNIQQCMCPLESGRNLQTGTPN